VWEEFPAAVGSDFERYYRHAVESGEPVAFDAYYPAPLDGWYEVRAWPSPDGLGVYFNEITSRVRAREQMELIAERDELLARVTSEMTDTLDPREALRRLARLLVPRLGGAAAAALVDTAALDGRYALLRQVGAWHVQDGSEVLGRPGDGVARFLSRDLMSALDHDRVVTEVSDPELRAALVLDALPDVAGPVVALPLRGRERLVGVVVVAAPGPGEFTDEELDTLSAIASRAGLAIDNARLFAEQRDLAEGLQRSLLSQAPHPDGLEVAVCYEAAAQTAQVGGDWYDAFVLESGDTVLVVGDVVGHDTEAAAAMGQMRSLLRGIAVHAEEGPADLLRGVDRVLSRLGAETTATALVARISGTPELDGSRRVRWSSAGHPAPLVVDPDGCRLLDSDAEDLLLGLDPHAERTEWTATVPHGGVLLLYTDGLVERRTEDLDIGLERLCATAGELGDPPVEGLAWWCDGLVARMVPETRDDDVALVAVRVGDERVSDEIVDPTREGVAVLLPADPVSVGRARALVREALAEAGTLVPVATGEERSVEDEAVLATSELVTNALVHAGTSVLLRVAAGPRGVRVEVGDGSAHSPVPRWHAITSATGRGLRLVDSLVGRWDVSRRPDGKTVWFQIGAPPGADVPDDVLAAPVATRRVLLRGLPLAMHWTWQEHAASLLREHLLLVLGEDPAALESHAAASDALDLLRERLPRPSSAALQVGSEDVADVEVEVPERSIESFAVLDRTLTEATRAASEGRLLGLPARFELSRLRAWMCREVRRQTGEGAEPEPFAAYVASRALRA
jgi:serine phosphatase RsbU (regulator of sigma subunit)/anti-sigma regulatory factor (Ser/Thr protein kinase)